MAVNREMATLTTLRHRITITTDIININCWCNSHSVEEYISKITSQTDEIACCHSSLDGGERLLVQECSIALFSWSALTTPQSWLHESATTDMAAAAVIQCLTHIISGRQLANQEGTKSNGWRQHLSFLQCLNTVVLATGRPCYNNRNEIIQKGSIFGTSSTMSVGNCEKKET